MFSRRFFLSATTAFALAPRFAIAKDEVPSSLDHILLGCSDLDHGIAFVEQHTGVRAAFGGIHPGRGTRNALLSLGERRYLEIIAPDPQQPNAPEIYKLRGLYEPSLVGWAAHPGDIEALANRLSKEGIAAEGPTPGSRKRPSGQLLQWKTLSLKDTANGLLPFFIEWSADSPHPSTDAPQGCHLTNFEALTPDPLSFSRTANLLLHLDLSILKGDPAQLRATIAGPKGNLTVISWPPQDF
jgi:hypothetical protein